MIIRSPPRSRHRGHKCQIIIILYHNIINRIIIIGFGLFKFVWVFWLFSLSIILELSWNNQVTSMCIVQDIRAVNARILCDYVLRVFVFVIVIVFVFVFVIVFLLVSSCPLITLIKCLKGHKSLGSLCMFKIKSVTQSVSEWQCHLLSCQTLVWTAKKEYLIFCSLITIFSLMSQTSVFKRLN